MNSIHAIEQKKEVLIWGEFDGAPHNIQTGPFQGQGIQSKLINEIKKSLSKHYILDERILPFSRLLRFYVTKGTYCTSPIFKTPERETKAYYSAVAALVLPYKLITRNGLLGPTDKKINLAKLISSEKYIIGMEQSSSLGELDVILESGKKNHGSSFFARPGVGAHTALIKMLQNKRIDIMLDIQEAAIYQNKLEQQKDQLPLSFYDIEEQKTKFTPAYYTCSKTDAGKRAMNKITELMESKNFNAKQLFLDGAKQWSDKKGMEDYSKYWDEAQILTNINK